MPETTPLIKAALNLRVGAGFDVYDWEKCIQWITNNCSNLYCLLNKRLVFLEEEATEAQKNFLLGGYYGCLERYFNRILVSVIAEVLRKRRKRYNEIYSDGGKKYLYHTFYG